MVSRVINQARHEQSAPLSQLHSLVLGEVLPCCGDSYHRRRLVNNKACQARPAVIVTPVTTEDVAITVNFARRNNYQVNTFLYIFLTLVIVFLLISLQMFLSFLSFRFIHFSFSLLTLLTPDFSILPLLAFSLSTLSICFWQTVFPLYFPLLNFLHISFVFLFLS